MAEADEAWGGKSGAAAKAQDSMEKFYGRERGLRIYAAKTAQREQVQSGVRGALQAVRRSTK